MKKEDKENVGNFIGKIDCRVIEYPLNMNRKISLKQAKARLKGYIKKYYQEVREDVINRKAFKNELYGYVVSLSHDIAQKPGWKGHNWRQALRRHLFSYALDEIEKIDKKRNRLKVLRKIFTFGLVR
jgi:hypothetical protein